MTRWRYRRRARTVPGMSSRAALAAAALLTAAAPLSCAGASAPRCQIQVTGLEEYLVRPGDVTVAYRVRGDAGAEGKVWLAARTAEGSWISGDGLEVGPGAFAAIVDLRLTGRAADYKVVLSVAERRCADDAPRPAP